VWNPTVGQRRSAEIIVGIIVVVVLDLFAGLQIEFGSVFSSDVSQALKAAEIAGAIGFLVILIAVVVAGLQHKDRAVLLIFVVFLAFATVHLVANIAALVLTAHVRNDSYLWGLWDVGSAYLMVVAVFTGWYWIADELIPEGAFDFPVPEGREAPTPNLIDYVFIAFNTNATFGPTVETVTSRRVKVLMMLQTMCSLLVLVVLVARMVSLT
jgi:hypothetical protein